MKNNLVPTTVINKNGVSTTVHKRADSSPPNSTAGIPPVSLGKKAPAAKNLSGLEVLAASPSKTAHDILWMFTHDKKRVAKKTQDSMVGELHEDTLATLDKPSSRFNAGVVSQVFYSCVRNKSMVSLNNLAVVMEVFNECDDRHASVFGSYIDGLQMYRNHSDPLIDWSSKGTDEQEVPKALVRAAIGLKKPYVQTNAWVVGNPRHITSDELTELIMKRPQDVQRIVDLVNQRDLPVDTEEGISTLVGLLDQEAENPLIGGLL